MKSPRNVANTTSPSLTELTVLREKRDVAKATTSGMRGTKMQSGTDGFGRKEGKREQT